MLIHIVPPGMDLRELAPVFLDVAAIGSTLAILTTQGLYVMHLDRIARDIGAGERAVVMTLHRRGHGAYEIARRLGLSQKFVDGCIYEKARKARKEAGHVTTADDLRRPANSDPSDPRADSESQARARRGLVRRARFGAARSPVTGRYARR